MPADNPMDAAHAALMRKVYNVPAPAPSPETATTEPETADEDTSEDAE